MIKPLWAVAGITLLVAVTAFAGATRGEPSTAIGAHVSPTVISTMTVAPDRAVGVGVNPATNKIYVGRNRSAAAGGGFWLSVFDGNTGSLAAEVPLGFGEYLSSIEPNVVSGKVYAVDGFTNTLFVVDGTTNTLLTSINSSLSNGPHCVAVQPESNRAYWLNFGQVSVINGVTDSIIGVISIPERDLRRCAINIVTNRLYVTSTHSSELFVIDSLGDAVIATLTLDGPSSVAVNMVTNRIYVANDAGTITVLNGETNAVEAVVPAGGGSYTTYVQVNPSTNRIYVSDSANGALDVIDGASNTVVASVPVGHGPLSIAVDAVTDRVYITVVDAGRIAIVGDGPSLETAAPISNLPAGGQLASPARSFVGRVVLALGLVTVAAAGAFLVLGAFHLIRQRQR